ncbi:MAG: M24 family metallopeptidase [Bacteroidetes bacterium]|nr:M24 family metallopeptidase [Bacteroidota bacterium]
MSRYDTIDPQLFINNRAKLAADLEANSMAILNANDQFPRNGDQLHKFYQNSDLFWASGLEQEQCILLLYPDAKNPKYKEVVFILKPNELLSIWDGSKYTIEDVKKISAIQTVLFLDDFEILLRELMNECEKVYLNAIEYAKFQTEVPYRDLRFTDWMKKEFQNHTFERLAPVLAKHRLLKSSIEIELIKKAISITANAFQRIIKFVKVGVKEYEIQAEIDHEFTISGANGHAYDPIIASGKNALCLHYTENNDSCKDGDLLLLDFGAQYANYASDLSRTIPVSGKFSTRQKECYEAVLFVYKKAISMMLVGITINELNAKVGKLMEEQMILLGLFSEEDVAKQDKEKPLFTKYFMHGNSHFIGLDVHDVGDKDTVFEEGMILSCEPGLYIAEEGLGIRIETNVLITQEGPVDLMAHIPVEVEEIENLMI